MNPKPHQQKAGNRPESALDVFKRTLPNLSIAVHRKENMGKEAQKCGKLKALFDNLVTIDELMDALGYRVSKKSIYRWVELRGLPAIKIGGRYYFHPEAVATWLETSR